MSCRTNIANIQEHIIKLSGKINTQREIVFIISTPGQQAVLNVDCTRISRIAKSGAIKKANEMVKEGSPILSSKINKIAQQLANEALENFKAQLTKEHPKALSLNLICENASAYFPRAFNIELKNVLRSSSPTSSLNLAAKSIIFEDSSEQSWHLTKQIIEDDFDCRPFEISNSVNLSP